MRVRFNEIPQDFIDEYNLANENCDGWTYLEIRKGCYSFPQSGKLANDLLQKRIAKHGYCECATTPVLWRHQWRSITFVLLVDDLGVEYVGECHARHLQNSLKEYYEITMDWEGTKYAGIDIKWDYAPIHKNCKARLSMEDYIEGLLIKVGHAKPIKAQLSPYKHTPIVYGDSK